MDDVVEFLRFVDTEDHRAIDRSHALLWWAGRIDPSLGMEVREICRTIEDSGHPKQNASRLEDYLTADKKRASRIPNGKGWRLTPAARLMLDTTYGGLIAQPRKPLQTNTVFPAALFTGTRGYIEKVVFQINASYDATLYDGCAVMCRRLLETLIIEVYEADGRPGAIKGPGGNFYMFADLLRIFDADKKFHLSRNGSLGLRDFKKLGDLSAHNRRFNARREDIYRIRDGIRVATEELLHLARFS